jgi:hypothetical protein
MIALLSLTDLSIPRTARVAGAWAVAYATTKIVQEIES